MRRDTVFIHDMELENAFGKPIDLGDGGALFEDVFLSVWRGDVDNDGYNALAQTAGLWSREIAILRAYGRYLQQAGIPQSQDFIAAALNRYPEIARGAVHAVRRPLRPGRAGRGRGDGQASQGEDQGCAGGGAEHRRRHHHPALPQPDRSLAAHQSFRCRNRMRAASSLAIKLDSRAVDGLPEPRPWREIFVYGAEVEGVHLRFGPVARGGLRWSDRAQDYRTEVLGLVKAQQVKNAVIVPVGAKGGFYPEAAAGRRQPRRDLRGRHHGLRELRLQPAVDHRQSRRRRRHSADRTWCAATATIPISSSPPTRARRPSPTPPTRISQKHRLLARRRLRLAAARPATTTRRWASPPAAPGKR